MTSASIGRVEWLDLREVWKNEAADFTPWLLANVDVLREALGLEFEIERNEHPVGSFSLDLIGTDLTNGARLIVENQIEQSDHGHLGQLVTYAAGTDAGTILWVAKAFRDEHRAALEWLNEQTNEDTRFFGVAVRALRIGDSPPAPFLEVVARPSDWQKTVRRVTAASESDEHAAYRAFWSPLRERLMAENPEWLSGRAEPKSMYLGTNSPIPGQFLSAGIGSGELRVELEIDTGDRERNLSVFEQLRQRRSVLESETGELDFLEGGYRSKIVKRLPWNGKLLTQPDRQDEARDWFYENLGALRRGIAAAVADASSEELLQP